MKNKIEVRFSKSAKGRRGCGRVDWKKLQAMMRMAGVLLPGQHIEKLKITKEGILFTTDKTGNKK